YLDRFIVGVVLGAGQEVVIAGEHAHLTVNVAGSQVEVTEESEAVAFDHGLGLVSGGFHGGLVESENQTARPSRSAADAHAQLVRIRSGHHGSEPVESRAPEGEGSRTQVLIAPSREELPVADQGSTTDVIIDGIVRGAVALGHSLVQAGAG